MNVVVTKRWDDYHACIDGKPEIWGCGKDVNAAIGDLIRSHKEVFEKIGLTVEYKEEK